MHLNNTQYFTFLFVITVEARIKFNIAGMLIMTKRDVISFNCLPSYSKVIRSYARSYMCM